MNAASPDVPESSADTVAPAEQAAPLPTMTRQEYGAALLRGAVAQMIRLSNEPARVREQNRMAGRIVGIKGVGAMRQISAEELTLAMLAEIAKTMAVIANGILILETGTGEMLTPAEVEQREKMKADAAVVGENGKGKA